ncbi:MAG: right-handed parallel beta-helix repeat-containing protein [Phycisphaerales bacterium]
MPRPAIHGVLTVAALAFAWPAIAGDLTPPGAPTPTMKTLDEVEPRTPLTQETAPGDADSVFRITQPGSYYLTENLFAPSGSQGVEIAIGNVTLDLSGFTIAGDVGSLAGISGPGGVDNIVIRNGFVQDMGTEGVHLTGELCVVEDLHAIRNGDTGIELFGASARIEGCIARDNLNRGITTGQNAVVRDCAVSGNESTGVFVSGGSVVIGCAVYQNLGDGISSGAQGQISDCSVRSNGGRGIATGFGAVISNCTARDNAQTGFALGSRSSLIGAVAYANGADGIVATSDCSVLDTTSSVNGGAGISATAGRVNVSGCNISNNSSVGIDMGAAGVVRDTRIGDNAVEGVVARGQCLLDRLHVVRNGVSAARNGVLLLGGENVVRQCVIVGNGSSISFGGSDVLDDNNILANP